MPLAVTSNIEQNNFLSNSPFFGYDGGEWLGCTLQCAKSLFYVWEPTLCNLYEETDSEQIFSIDEEVDSWSCWLNLWPVLVYSFLFLFSVILCRGIPEVLPINLLFQDRWLSPKLVLLLRHHVLPLLLRFSVCISIRRPELLWQTDTETRDFEGKVLPCLPGAMFVLLSVPWKIWVLLMRKG